MVRLSGVPLITASSCAVPVVLGTTNGLGTSVALKLAADFRKFATRVEQAWVVEYRSTVLGDEVVHVE